MKKIYAILGILKLTFTTYFNERHFLGYDCVNLLEHQRKERIIHLSRAFVNVKLYSLECLNHPKLS
jgi:hypothetical protein